MPKRNKFYSPFVVDLKKTKLKQLPKEIRVAYGYGKWALDGFSRYKGKKEWND